MLETDVELKWGSKKEVVYASGIALALVTKNFPLENVMVASPAEMIRRFARQERTWLTSVWHIFESGGEPIVGEGLMRFVPPRFVLREELCGPSVTHMSPYFASYGTLAEAEDAVPLGAQRLPKMPGANDGPRLRASFLMKDSKLT